MIATGMQDTEVKTVQKGYTCLARASQEQRKKVVICLLGLALIKTRMCIFIT